MTVATSAIPTLNGKPVPVTDVRVVPWDDFREALHEHLAERLAIEGLESGDGGTLTQADWKEMRAKLEERIAQHQ